MKALPHKLLTAHTRDLFRTEAINSNKIITSTWRLTLAPATRMCSAGTSATCWEAAYSGGREPAQTLSGSEKQAAAPAGNKLKPEGSAAAAAAAAALTGVKQYMSCCAPPPKSDDDGDDDDVDPNWLTVQRSDELLGNIIIQPQLLPNTTRHRRPTHTCCRECARMPPARHSARLPTSDERTGRMGWLARPPEPGRRSKQTVRVNDNVATEQQFLSEYHRNINLLLCPITINNYSVPSFGLGPNCINIIYDTNI